MYTLSEQMNSTVDTMGRSYNAEKDLIALAEDDADDIWAGDYYPRRYPSEHFSLEYLDWYSTSDEKTIALVSGIYETSTEAKAALKNLRSFAPEAFVVKAEVYVGCMH